MRIQTNWLIHPKDIGSDIEKIIEDGVREKFYNKTFGDYGYILDIEDILIDIYNNTINIPDHFINVPVTLNVVNIKPVIGGKFHSKISFIFEKGLMTLIAPDIKMIITAENMKEYVYDPQNNTFVNDNGSILAVGGNVMSTIKTYRVENDKFQCIGTLDEEVVEYKIDSDDFTFNEVSSTDDNENIHTELYTTDNDDKSVRSDIDEY